ncbi:MAG: hypothetical protein KDB82_10890 [Planctomycetes bacterium]|nr:hypothetical protein [Planctomycetota bacterium]
MTTRLVKRPRIDPRKSDKDPLKRLRQNTRTPLVPVPFAQALTVLLSEQKKVNRSRLQRVRGAWEMAIQQIEGIHAAAAKQAEVRSVSKTGVVKVTVGNPGLAHELGVVYRETLLAKMRELLQGKDSVSDLVVQSRGRRK